MNLSSTLFVLRWLVRDTFRQARASGIYWLMLGVSGMCIAVCLSVGVSNLPFKDPDAAGRLPAGDPEGRKADPGVDKIKGEITFAFGAIRVPSSQYREQVVRSVQWTMTGLIADTLGVLMALIFTAGFLPAFVNRGTAEVLVAKPIPRWTLLSGKFLGVLIFVAFQVLIFSLGTWFALGIKTGYWEASYLVCLPILLIHFAVFFSFSTLLAVTTRSTVACVFGSLVFWLICWGMNFGHHTLAAQPIFDDLSPIMKGLLEVGYWVLPKPADFGTLLLEALQAEKAYSAPFDIETLRAKGMWQPGLSVLSSCVFAVVMLYLAAREWVTTDY